MTWYFSKYQVFPTQTNCWTCSFQNYCRFWITYIEANPYNQENLIINDSINHIPNHFIRQYFPILIKHHFLVANSFLILFTVAGLNYDSNILITCYLWVLCFFWILCVIYPTWKWWTFSFLNEFYIIIFSFVSMAINIDVVLLSF